jgi:ABC-type antimicrobial peptide transport system permease subunit
VWVVLKTSVEPNSVLPAVRGVLAELDAEVPIASARPLREVWTASMERELFVLTLLTVFGLTALLLATVGVYGVTAQAARRRTQEIGIRMALGASGQNVVSLMVRQGIGVVVLGLAVGLVSALVTTRALASLLYGIEPTDPGTLAAVVALLGGVAVVACYVPARRATTVDPVRSLRAE